MLVTRESATRGLFGSDFRNTFAIDKDHSDMVKYPDQDPVCGEVLVRLHDICAARRSRSTANGYGHRGITGHRPSMDLLGTSDLEASQELWVQGKQIICME